MMTGAPQIQAQHRRGGIPALLRQLAVAWLCFGALGVGSTPLAAQSLRTGKMRPQALDTTTLVERLNAMPADERKRLLDRMPPARRELLEKRIQQYNAIKPDARLKLKKAYEDFQNLPPEKQAQARRIFRDINDLEAPRRQQVRGAITRLRPLEPDERQRRLASRAFRDRFSEDEAKLIREALDVLPPVAKEEPPTALPAPPQ